jgi:hypothetical protein
MKGGRVKLLNLHGLHYAMVLPPKVIRPLRHLDHYADVGDYIAQDDQLPSSVELAAERWTGFSGQAPIVNL